jgi:hypothetical protein
MSDTRAADTRLREASEQLIAQWIDQGDINLALKKHPSREWFHGNGEGLKACARQLRRALNAGLRGDALPPPPQPYEEAYFELIYAVGMKHPNESRHQTALRYIRQAEEVQGPAMQVGALPPPRRTPETTKDEEETKGSR